MTTAPAVMRPSPPTMFSEMRPLAGECLLSAVESASGEHTLLRPITLLAATLHGCERAQLLHLPLGELNRLLLEVHRLSFGAVLEGYAACTQCGTAMEFRVAVDAALQSLDASVASMPTEWVEDGRPLRLRPVTTTDLLDSIDAGDAESAAARLLSRCLEYDEPPEARSPSAPTEPRVTTDPSALTDSARARFDSVNAASEMHCRLRCPDCAHEAAWELAPGHFLWSKARHAARRLLADVHQLALNYGWSEHSILEMSPRRRDGYLEMLSA